MLTHGNIWANVVQTENWTNPAYLFSGEERYLVVIPYFHIYAFSVCMMVGLRIGALQIIHPKYDPDAVLSAIREFRPTYFPAVPTVFVSLLNHPKVDESGLEHVRLFNSGGAPCPVEVMEEFERRIGRPLNEGYGLSETSPVTHSTAQLAFRKLGSIGLPFPGTDTKIVDVETGTRELPIGEAGELCVCGPQVMKGYWNKPEESADVLRTDAGGRTWFHTGDIARMDEDGFTSIVQRKKDLIIVDGFNVYPSDVESVLYSHPAVRLAAVIGIPDAYHGEIVKACIALKPGTSVTSDDIVAFCRESLTEYKVPRVVEIRDTLPMSAVGKILYRVLRDEHAAAGARHEPRRSPARHERPRVLQEDARGRDAAPADDRLARHPACRGRGRTRGLHGDLRRAFLQRHRRRARRVRRDAARHGARLRDQLGDARRPALHHARAEGEPHAPADEGSRPAALRSDGRPRRRPHGDVRRPHRGQPREAIRTRHDHLHRGGRPARLARTLNQNPEPGTLEPGTRYMADFIRYELKDGVAVLTIDNPPVNALAPAVWEQIDVAVARAVADPAAEAIVLIGAGTTFIAGADIKMFDVLKTPQDSMTRSAGTHALLRRVEDATKPLVAAIHGNALGGGMEVAMSCHYRVAAKDAKVGQPEVLLGIIPGAGGTQRLPRLAGAELALQMCTDGKLVAAPKAKAAGMVDEVIEGDLLAGAIAFAKKKAAAHAVRRVRDIAINAEAAKAGLNACAKMRESLAKTARGLKAPFAVVDAVEAGLKDGFDAGSIRERELFADCVVSTESKALRHLFFAEREVAKVPDVPERHAGEGDHARGGGRRRHDGRRHRDELRERGHPGPPEGRGRSGARARASRPSARTTR